MSEANFISQKDAQELLGRTDVSFVDTSWYLPAQGRDGEAEFNKMRIPGAVFFDIDKVADTDTDLPHMLPTASDFARQVSVLGISNDNLVVIYDGPGLFSAPRAWWTFKTMGAMDVRILEGGMDGWKEAGLPIETGNPNPPRARMFSAELAADRVASQKMVLEAAASNSAVILDARPNPRFLGKAPEPRAGLRSGHIPGSLSLPFGELMDDTSLKSPEALDKLFSELGVSGDQAVITTCGSGVTAAIISLALAQSGRTNTKLYDGSWAEWGLPDGPEIEPDDSE
ncbi:MAG: 3-mercaptopyruvate sulfurtransferase [Pseudomonadota bacterium]